MDYRTEFSFSLPEELVKTLGIDEDTAFETYFEDGRVKVRILDEEDFENDVELSEDIEKNDELNVPEKCVLCPNFCWHCRKCTIDI